MRALLLLGAVAAVALAIQSGLILFAAYVALGVGLLSRFLARRWVESLEVTRDAVETPVEIGTAVEVRVRVTNTGTLPVAWVLVEDLLPDRPTRTRPPRLTLKGKRLRVALIWAGKSVSLKYKLQCESRGYYQLGPVVLETGDVFGLHRRHRVLGEPVFLQVQPKVLPLPKYDFASERPIGEVRLIHYLFEDPTRTAGVRPYQIGDPLQRVHWRATARTGELHSRVYEPTSLAGATVLLDFHADAYPAKGEPQRSDLAVTVAVALAYAVTQLNQRVGLVSNGRDAADRVRVTRERRAANDNAATREAVRAGLEMADESDRLRPVVVETGRGVETFAQIRDALARLEVSDGLSFPRLVLESIPRMPRDATVIAVLAAVPVETAVLLGTLRRQGFAVSAVLVAMGEHDRPVAHGRLAAEGIRDVRAINREEELAGFGTRPEAQAENPYEMEMELV